METKKAWDWIKEHKKEILITTGSVIGIGVLGYFGVKVFKNANAIMVKLNESGIDNHCFWDQLGKLELISSDWRDNPVAKLDHVTITDLWDEGDYTNAIIDGFTAADMGKVGEELIANVPNIKADTMLSAVMSAPIFTEAE